MDNGFAEGYAVGQGNNNYGGMGAWGGEWMWIIVLFALFGGWGGNGFGYGGGNCNVDAAVQRGFDTQSIISKLDGINGGICDSTFALNNTITNGFSGVQQSLCQGFNGIQREVSDLGYRLQDCCCQTQRAIDGVNYNMAKNTCDITNAINGSTQQILGYLTSEKINALQAENQTLKFAASQSAQNAFIVANQEAQTAELIRRLGRDCPIPAYVVPNPNCCYPTNDCGCGCGCGR